MTTIAYKDGIVATDGFLTQGSRIVQTDYEKAILMDGVMFFFAGVPAYVGICLKGYFDGSVEEEDVGRTDEIYIFAWDKDKDQFVEFGFDKDGAIWKFPVNNPTAIGSGSAYATGAMDAGMSAKEAVKVASTRDIYTGGKIRTYRVG